MRLRSRQALTLLLSSEQSINSTHWKRSEAGNSNKCGLRHEEHNNITTKTRTPVLFASQTAYNRQEGLCTVQVILSYPLLKMTLASFYEQTKLFRDFAKTRYLEI